MVPQAPCNNNRLMSILSQCDTEEGGPAIRLYVSMCNGHPGAHVLACIWGEAFPTYTLLAGHILSLCMQESKETAPIIFGLESGK